MEGSNTPMFISPCTGKLKPLPICKTKAFDGTEAEEYFAMTEVVVDPFKCVTKFPTIGINSPIADIAEDGKDVTFIITAALLYAYLMKECHFGHVGHVGHDGDELQVKAKVCRRFTDQNYHVGGCKIGALAAYANRLHCYIVEPENRNRLSIIKVLKSALDYVQIADLMIERRLLDKDQWRTYRKCKSYLDSYEGSEELLPVSIWYVIGDNDEDEWNKEGAE